MGIIKAEKYIQVTCEDCEHGWLSKSLLRVVICANCGKKNVIRGKK